MRGISSHYYINLYGLTYLIVIASAALQSRRENKAILIVIASLRGNITFMSLRACVAISYRKMMPALNF